MTAKIAQIMGWAPAAVLRDKQGRIMASWFPVNSHQAVLYSGLNHATVNQWPFSLALTEEYCRLPRETSAGRNSSPYPVKAKR